MTHPCLLHVQDLGSLQPVHTREEPDWVRPAEIMMIMMMMMMMMMTVITIMMLMMMIMPPPDEPLEHGDGQGGAGVGAGVGHVQPDAGVSDPSLDIELSSDD